MTNPREQFSTEEFLRYSAECRRMAGLARNPRDTGKHGAVPGMAPWSIERVTQNWMQFLNSSKRYQELAAGSVHQ